MSESSEARPIREIAVADHIWEAFEQMALEMGTERDGLINQAMFMFARLNGFLNVGQAAIAAAPPARVAAPAAQEAFERPPAAFADEPEPEPEPMPEPAEEEYPPEQGLLEDRTPIPAPAPVRRPAAPPPRRSEPPLAPPRRTGFDQDGEMRRRMTEAATPSPEMFEGAPDPMDEDPDRKAVAERVLETAAELERLIKGKQQQQQQQQVVEEPLPHPDPMGMDDTPAPAPAPTGKSLYMMAEGGSLEKITKDRFLIGRGKHCDMVINSGKVSREHAAITREGDEYYIEDLGSSNGTWFNKQRIKRRKIEEGDEYFICSDKVKFVLR